MAATASADIFLFKGYWAGQYHRAREPISARRCGHDVRSTRPASFLGQSGLAQAGEIGGFF